MLFTTPGVEEFISGVILYEETLGQATSGNVPFPEYLASRGIIPGIKVDVGAQKMALFPNELVTEGLDGLRGRLSAYYARGARFAKWRAVITIGDGIPTESCIDANAHALARYAALCQEAGIVPIIEPEVLMDGAHDIARCADVTSQALNCVYDWLWRMRVMLEGTLLKPNMVLPGTKSGQTAEPERVAVATLEVLKRCVPAAVPGIVFLSGGQSAEEATANLSAMNAVGRHPGSCLSRMAGLCSNRRSAPGVARARMCRWHRRCLPSVPGSMDSPAMEAPTQRRWKTPTDRASRDRRRQRACRSL